MRGRRGAGSALGGRGGGPPARCAGRHAKRVVRSKSIGGLLQSVRIPGRYDPVLVSAFKRGFSTFNKATTLEGKIALALLLVLIAGLLAGVLYESASDAYVNYRVKHLSPGEHLRIAHDLCPDMQRVFICVEPYAEQAIGHLQKIPPSAPEYTDASKLLSSIQSSRERQRAIHQQQEQERAALLAKGQAERNRLMSQSEEESRKQMWSNVSGQAHDAFTCSTSPENSPIMSFDYGRYWWVDDGRCAAQQAKQEQQREEAEQQKDAQEQKKRDQDAELLSYWPTTLRVDTDMDSFWLPNEERTCQTYPAANGRVATVACSTSGSHRDHNIPVRFWGGVDRNRVSDWKCRREEDQFVCRAID